MKKTITKLISTTLILGMLGTSALATSGVSQDLVLETNQLLGIINGDEHGNLNLNSTVSRAEFSKMMVSASLYKDVSENAKFSIFSDVSASHWASPYIKIAVEQGWFVGYADGTFQPNSNITLEAGAAAVLRMLGYDDLDGSYPSAQLSKFYELNLDEGITATQGENLSRNDCANLFYNLMNTKTSTGVIYAQTLGYPVTATGTLDTLKLTSMFTDGPYIFSSVGSLPFEIGANTTIYKNNKSISVNEIRANDVCYYNEEVDTVWVYNDSVTGRISYIDSVLAPSKITVSGNTYSFETQDASRKLTSGGQFEEGDLVTLLLGENGMVADVISPISGDDEINGVVLSTGLMQYDDFTEKTVTVITTDGTVQTHGSDGKDYEKGDLVTINFTDGEQEIKTLRQKSLDGKVSNDGEKIGSYEFADDVQILEISGESYGITYPNRLAGYELDDDDVIYYSLNSDDEIEQMIIEDTTGDLQKYGIVTDITSIAIPNSMSSQNVYQYVLEGKPNVLNAQSTVYPTDEGGAQFIYENGAISSIKSLKETNLKSINNLSATSSDGEFLLADNVQVYEKIGDIYHLVSKESVSDTSKYDLTAYYDNFGYSAGEQIRIIIAEKK